MNRSDRELPRRCLVVGAGLIGSHVAAALSAEGATVTVLSRGFNPWLDAGWTTGIRLHAGDVRDDPELLAELVAEADAVVHLASSSRPPTAARDPLFDLRETVIPALVVLDQVVTAARPPRFVVATSGGTVYGNPQIVPTPESHPLAPRTPYAISDVAVEHYVGFYAERHGIDTTILRFSNVYGPGALGRGGQGVIATWLRQIAAGEEPILLASPNLTRDFVYADDAAQAVVAVLRRGSSRVYNVGSSSDVSLATVLETVLRVTGAPRSFTPLTGGPDHATGHVHHVRLDTSLLSSETGWAPAVQLDEGIRRTWEWLQARSTATDIPNLAGGA